MHAMRAPLSSPWQVGRQGPRAALNSPAGQKEAPGHRLCTMHGGEQEKTQVSSVLVRPIGFSRPGFGAEIKREKIYDSPPTIMHWFELRAPRDLLTAGSLV